MALKQYSPKDVTMTFGGVPFSGFTDGDFITVEWDDDAFTLEKGADGETCWVANASYMGTVTVTLMSSSATNDYLSGIHIGDRVSLAGVLPLFIKDSSPNGRDLVTAAEARIVKMPTITKGNDVGTREWTFKAGELIIYAGGL